MNTLVQFAGDDRPARKKGMPTALKRCAVSREYVNRLRPTVTCDQVTSERNYVTKHGTIGKAVSRVLVRAYDQGLRVGKLGG